MGKGIRYTDEFKQEAVNQVVVHGYPVSEVSQRLGISTKSLYVWIKKFSKPRQLRENESDWRAENARLKRELLRRRSWVLLLHFPCWWTAPSLRQNCSMREIAKIDQKTIRLYFQEGNTKIFH